MRRTVAALLLAAGGAGAALAIDPLPAAGLPTPPVVERSREPAPERPILRAVELRVDAPSAEVATLAAALALPLGQPLAVDAVERALRALAATGLASEVEAWQRRRPDGVELVFAVRTSTQVGEIRLTGTLPIAERQLLALLPQRAGQPLVEDRVLRGISRLEEQLRGEGYLEARVRLKVTVDPQNRRATVVYQVEAGARSRLAAVHFEGERGGLDERELASALRLKVGDFYRPTTLREEAERLERFLVAHDYRLATVEEPRESFDAEHDRVELTYRLNAGPKVEVEIVGATRRELQRKDLLPFLSPTGYDEALVLQSISLVRRYYQTKGHYKVTVDKQELREGDRLRLRLEVRAGPLFELRELRFAGNHALSGTELAQRMTTTPRKALRLGSGRLVDEVLAEDLTNLRSTYALLGYGSARVGPAQIEEKGSELTLVLPIEEGQRRVVESVALAGVESIDLAKLAAHLPLVAGGPYHRLLLDQSAELVRSTYEREGFGAVIVSPTVDWNAAGDRARVTIAVLEGGRTVVDRVLLRGNRRTKTEVVERFIDLKPGAPVSAPKLLEIERDLYRLGLFSRVEVRLGSGVEGAAQRDVLVDVEEGRSRRLGLGLGYDSKAGARVLLTLGESNLWGRAVNAQIDVLESKTDERYRLVLTQPSLGRWRLNLLYTLYSERQTRDLYDLRRRGMQVGLERALGHFRLRLIYDYHLSDVSKVKDELAIPVGSRSGRVSSITPVVLYDRRDDPLDPHRGWSILGQVQWAAPLVLADASFLKGFVQLTGALPAGKAGVLAGSFRLGALEPLGVSVHDPVGIAERVPIDERFFGGGRTSHRAFGQDDLGIAGETLINGSPVGGSGLLLLNFDYRFPIAGDFGGTLFTDGGNVWAKRGEIDPQKLRWGAGLGVRYRSPVGPLRLELGWNLDRKPGESRYVWFFSLGNPF